MKQTGLAVFVRIQIALLPGQIFGQVEVHPPLDLDEFASEYYKKPDPEKAALVLKDYIALADRFPNGQAALNAFFNRIFFDNPALKKKYEAIIHTAHGNIQKGLLAALQTEPQAYLAQIPSSPARNDALWGAFFASGLTSYLDDLLKTSALAADLSDMNTYLTGATAQWSLCSNSKTHVKVREYLESKAKIVKDKKPVQELLTCDPTGLREKIIETIRTRRAKGVW